MELKSLIKYQCWTTIKPLIVFYMIYYGIIGLVYLITYLAIGNLNDAHLSGTEFACFIYLGITGSLGFNEDFKMAIQNGFTRKQIFMAAISMFGFVSLTMSFIDTVVVQFMPSYISFFENIYGLGHNLFIQWAFLALLYFVIVSGSYLGTLVANKIGKKKFYIGLISFVLIVLFLLPIGFQLYIPNNMKDVISKGILNIIGYAADGTIHFVNPFLSSVLLGTIISVFAYLLVKKTELK